MFNHQELSNAGFKLPKFDVQKITENTLKRPVWIHFGAGNIFRMFIAKIAQNLLNQNLLDTGIIVAEGYDEEIIDSIFKPYNNETIAVTLKSDGSIDTELIASMVLALKSKRHEVADFEILKNIFKNPSLQIVSFTITEKGYELKDSSNNYFPFILKDFELGPNKAESYLGIVTSLLHERFIANQAPITLVSMDNYSKNGDKLKNSITTIARKWLELGLVEKKFVDYLENPKKVFYPWTMIDKITPRPDSNVKAMLVAKGLKNIDEIITKKNTYIAPFVNAEETEYLAIEDVFPNGRPPLEKSGVLFSDRETVDKIEKMKVGTCLNPLHTSLAIFGCLLEFNKISKMMEDPLMVKLIEAVGYQEGLKVVVDPKIINPKNFIDEVINKRLKNPFMPDTPQRIATDTSQKIPIRFGHTIKTYMERPDLNSSDLKIIPLVLAGWLRYLLEIDDSGKPFVMSPDPLANELKAKMSGIHFKDTINLNQVTSILYNKNIFAVDLKEAKLDNKIVAYFNELNAGEGAIRSTLKKYLEL